MKAFRYNKVSYDFSIFEPKSYEKGKELLNIKRNHFIDNNNTYTIEDFQIGKLSIKSKKYRIIMNTGMVGGNDFVATQLNWFEYLRFSWIQKKCWVQQDGNVKYIIGFLTSSALPTIFKFFHEFFK
jgi:hypothetical protein